MSQELLKRYIREIIKEVITEFHGSEGPVVTTDLDIKNNPNKSNPSESYLMTVTNNDEGIEIIKGLKSQLGKFFNFKLRGRHSDRKSTLGGKWQSGTQNDIPTNKAERIAIYLIPKK